MTDKTFNIELIDGKGNGLIALRDISKREIIFKEKPFVWEFKSKYNEAKKQVKLCHLCGAYLSHAKIDPVKCFHSNENGCNALYCSEECRESDKNRGHKWICKESNSFTHSLIKQLEDFDENGHFRLCLYVYCMIAKVYEETNISNDNVFFSPIEAAEQVLNGFHMADFCKIMKAIRDNTLEVNDDLFHNIIAPAYFVSYLNGGYEIIKEIMKDPSSWKSHDANDELLTKFMSSDIFSESYFRNIMGAFLSNNLEIKIILENNEMLIGSGLYSTYSKMNHSCECNTIVETDLYCGTEVIVIAARDIKKGEEIMTTYLHEDPKLYAVKHRKRDLIQYLFHCKCNLCTIEESEGGGEDDDASQEDY